MAFQDFLNSLLQDAVGGNQPSPINQPPNVPPPVASAAGTPEVMPIAPANGLPPEMVRALTGMFAGRPPPQMAEGYKPKKKDPNAPPPKVYPSYQMAPGEVAGPEVPASLEEVRTDAGLPEYSFTSANLPKELSTYEFGPNEAKKYIWVPDKKYWQPVPTKYYDQLLSSHVIDDQGMPVETPRLPDLSAPSEDDIKQWQVALPEDVLGKIKTEAETDVSNYQSQIEEIGGTYLVPGKDDQESANKQQELEVKLKEAQEEVDQYEALQYILYGIEPPKSRKEQVFGFIAPIISGAGRIMGVSDVFRSQIGRRLGGFLLANMSSDDIATNIFWRSMGLLPGNPINALMAPLNQVLKTLSPEERDDLQNTYHQDGSIGVWEKYIAGMPDRENWPTLAEFAWHGLTDTLFDPLTYIPGAALAADEMRGMNAAANPLIGSILKVAEPTLRYTDIASNIPGTVMYRGGGRVARLVKSAVENQKYWEKLSTEFAPSLGGEGKLFREATGASGPKLLAAADEYDNLAIGKTLPNAGGASPGITPAGTPGSPLSPNGNAPAGGALTPGGPNNGSAPVVQQTPGAQIITPANITPVEEATPVVGGLTRDALDNPPVERVTPEPGGPQVIGPRMGVGTKTVTAAPKPILSLLEQAVQAVDENPDITHTGLSKKLKITAKDAKELLPRAITARDVLRGELKVHPTNVPGLVPYVNNNRILDMGYKSFLEGEERGRRFIEEVNPILQKYEEDPVYTTRLRDLDESQPGFGAVAWPQKAKALAFVADIATVYAKYFDNLNDSKAVNYFNTSYRGHALGDVGYTDEFTQSLLEELALGDLTPGKAAEIKSFLERVGGSYTEVESRDGRTYNRAIGGLKDAETGELPDYAASLIASLEDTRKRFEEALAASKKAPKVPKKAEVKPADVIASGEQAASDNPDLTKEIELILDQSDENDVLNQQEILDKLRKSEPVDTKVSYPGNPNGGMDTVDEIIYVEDGPVGSDETVELVDTPTGQSIVITAPKPSTATRQARAEAAKKLEDAHLDNDEVEALAQKTSAALRAKAEASKATEVTLPEVTPPEVTPVATPVPPVSTNGLSPSQVKMAELKQQRADTLAAGGDITTLDRSIKDLQMQMIREANAAAKAVEPLSLTPDEAVKEVVKREVTGDAHVPEEKVIVMTPEETAQWRSENVTSSVLTGSRGTIIEHLIKEERDHPVPEGEIEDIATEVTGDAKPRSTDPVVAATPRPSTPGRAAGSLFPTQQELYNIGTEDQWAAGGYNIPDSSKKRNPTSLKNFKRSVTPRGTVDLNDMYNQHVNYFRRYLAKLNGLDPKTAIIEYKVGNKTATKFAENVDPAFEEATQAFWDTMKRYAYAMRTEGESLETMGIDRRGFFANNKKKISYKPAAAVLTDQQQANLDLFDSMVTGNKSSFSTTIDIPNKIDVDPTGRSLNDPPDVLGGNPDFTNYNKGDHWDFVPNEELKPGYELSYSVDTSNKFDPGLLGSDVLDDPSFALDPRDIEHNGKLMVQADLYDHNAGKGEDQVIGYADSIEEAKLIILKDMLQRQHGIETEPIHRSWYNFDKTPAGEKFTGYQSGLRMPNLPKPNFKQLTDLRDLLNDMGYSAKKGRREVKVAPIPKYNPNPKRGDLVNFAGQMGYLAKPEVKFWDKRIDVRNIDFEKNFLEKARDKKFVEGLRTGKNIDPAKISAMSQSQREHMIAIFGPAAGIKNPLTYPKRVTLTDKVMLDVLSKVDLSMLGPNSAKIYAKLGETEANRTRLGNIFVSAVKNGYTPDEAEDLIVKLSGLYTGPPNMLNNWNTAVGQAFMYAAPKAPFAVTQDFLNDALVSLADGDPSAVKKWSQLMVEIMKSNAAGSDSKLLRWYKNADTPVLDEINAFNKGMGENIRPSVQSQRGGKYDTSGMTYINTNKTVWEEMGLSLGDVIDKKVFRKKILPGQVGKGPSRRVLGTIAQLPAPSTVMRLRNMMDDAKRLGVDHTYEMKHYGEQMQKFKTSDLDRVAKKMGKAQGITMTGDTLLHVLLTNANSVYFGMPVFSPADIRRTLTKYVGAGQAEHLARSWSAQVTALKDAAAKQTDKMLYSYTPTNLDAQLSHIWMFHYWASRASTTHARLALENPYIMAAYYRMFEGTKRMAEEKSDVVPGWAKLFLPLQAGPYGMLGLVSPAAMFTGLSVVLDLQGINPSDMSWVDALQLLPMKPILQSAMAMTVSDRLPDPSGTAQTRWYVKTALNFFRNMGVIPGVDEGLTDDYVANATYRLQALAHHHFPGSQELQKASPQDRDTQQVKFYAIKILQDREMFIDPETGAVSEDAGRILGNIDAGLYTDPIAAEALRQFSVDAMYGAIGKSFLFSTIYPGAEGAQRNLARAGREAQNADSVPDLSVPPMASPNGEIRLPEFVDMSQEPTPEQSAAQLAVRLGDSGSKEATELIAKMDAFKKIGTKDQQETYKAMNDAIYEPASVIENEWGGEGVRISPDRFFTWDEWDAFSEGERRAWMDEWLANIDQKDDNDRYKQLRDQYTTQNPVIQGYLDWQSQVNKLGPEVFLERVLKDSEPFRIWWESENVQPGRVRQSLMSESAYVAAQGNKGSVYDPAMVNTESSPDLSSVLPPKTSDAPTSIESWASLTNGEKLNKINDQESIYMIRLQEFDDRVKEVTGGRGYAMLAPVSRRDVDLILERMGLAAPEPTGEYGRYVAWTRDQPPGSDISPEYYVNSGASDQRS